MKKRIITSTLVVAFVLSTLIMPSFLLQSPLKCSSLSGCGEYLQCPDRGFELVPCVLDCESGHIVICDPKAI